MLKRVFWLVVIAASAGLIWQWIRQRQSEFDNSMPELAPPRPQAQINQGAQPAVSRPASSEAASSTPISKAEQPKLADSNTAKSPDAASDAAQSGIQGYCMRCHAKRPIAHAHEEISESGRRAARGTCPVCGTNMFTFLAANGDERGANG